MAEELSITEPQVKRWFQYRLTKIRNSGKIRPSTVQPGLSSTVLPTFQKEAMPCNSIKVKPEVISSHPCRKPAILQQRPVEMTPIDPAFYGVGPSAPELIKPVSALRLFYENFAQNEGLLEHTQHPTVCVENQQNSEKFKMIQTVNKQRFSPYARPTQQQCVLSSSQMPYYQKPLDYVSSTVQQQLIPMQFFTPEFQKLQPAASEKVFLTL